MDIWRIVGPVYMTGALLIVPGIFVTGPLAMLAMRMKSKTSLKVDRRSNSRETCMTSSEVTIRFSMHGRNLFVGKVTAAVLLGFGLGLFYHWTSLEDYDRGVHLTLSDYTAGFDTYRLGLMSHYWPMWGDLILVILLIALFLALYEGLAYFIAWLLGITLRPAREPARVQDLIP